MTTPTPTSNNGVQGISAPDAGLPDLQTLNRLAGEFFAQLPGLSQPLGSVPQGQQPAGIGSVGNPVPTEAPPRISAAPRPEPEGRTPDLAPTQTGGRGHTTPVAYAAALPTVSAGSGVPDSGSPFYFLTEAGAARSNPSALPGIDDRITAESFGLPGAEALRALLSTPSHSRTPAPAISAASHSGNHFYFLDSLNSPPPTRTSATSAGAPSTFDIHAVRRDFPILSERVNGKQLIWFDNAATTHKPKSVIERISYFYEHENSNIHRAAHELAARATDAYEAAREKVRAFINAGSVNEIVFVRGTTEAINLVAKSWGAQYLNRGDEIVISWLEHHANIVPWQQLAAEKGLVLKVIPVDDRGQILLDEYAKLLGPKVKLVSFTQVSNALGTVTPAQQMVAMAHAVGAKVLVDGAQSVSHLRTDVQSLDADWFVFSGHKMFGPTGIGVVYGKEELLNATQPWQGGGNMIKDVTFEHTEYHDAPGRFEAGTGNIADAVGLGAAIDYINKLGIDNINSYEHLLLEYGTHHLQSIPGLTLIGTAQEKASVLSFVLDGFTTTQVGNALSKEGIAVRTGHHCAQPILRRFGLEATVRPSLAFYNTCEEIDRMLAVVRRLARGKGKIAA
ncbi:MAG TPA: family 2A encapsulin nanocompartment cargo protein cysteine desulfurase [Fluviicoccus sp.]|nr:family 2A encapsulin nanocompartment cargo protein cysteine desulfurase [Fluviicoccus sp.]